MKERDEIEELYSELKGYSKEPPKKLWDLIEEGLQPKKKKRRNVIFLWGIAASILIIVTSVYLFKTNTTTPNPDLEIISTVDSLNNKIESDNINSIDEIVKGNYKKDSLNDNSQMFKEKRIQKTLTEKNNYRIKADNTITNANDKQENTTANTKINELDKPYSKNTNEALASKPENNNLNTQDSNKILTTSENEQNAIVNSSIPDPEVKSPNSAEKPAINNNKKIAENILETKKISTPKWSVEFLGGMSNISSNNSSIQGVAVNSSSLNEIVYNFRLGYSISDRWTVKTGIGNNVLGQEIDKISYTGSQESAFVDASQQNIVSNQNIILIVSPESIASLAQNINPANLTINQGLLKQQFTYLQIPLEFSYTVLGEQNYNISLGLGGNLNFLTENKTFLNEEQIGESLNIDSTVFGLTINTNFSFNISKKILLFLEPSYNYFQKPVESQNQEFNNTQFKAQLGIRYKF